MTLFSNKTISASCIDLINRKIIEFQNDGKKIIKLNIGNLDTDRPLKISEITNQEFDSSNHYTNIRGHLELRQLIADKLKKEKNLVYDINKEMTMVSGTRSGIFHTFNAILNEGDEVIIPRGTWVTYFNMLDNFKAKAVLANTKSENNYKLTPEILEKCITKKTKAVIITNPGNPTGAIFSKDELSALLNVVKKHKNIIIMADEIYADIKFTDEKVYSVAEVTDDSELRKQIVVFTGFSKNLSMAGDRIAYVLTHNQELLSRIYGTQALINSCVNNIAQIMAIKMLKKDLTEYYYNLINRLKSNRDFALGLIKDVKGITANKPDGALYVMLDYSNLKKQFPNNKQLQNDMEFCNYLLENGVALTPGEPFGLENSVRICFACSKDDLQNGLTIIKNAVEKLK